MSERDGIMLAIECVNRHNHGFIKCDPMFVHGYNEAVKTISKELGALLETPLIGGDYFEGFSEGIKVGRNEMIEAPEEVTRLRAENARLREERDLLHAILTNVSLSMEAFDVNAAIREGGKAN